MSKRFRSISFMLLTNFLLLAAALLVAHSIRAGGFDWIIDLIALGRTARVDLGPFAGLVVIVGVGCAIAISVDVQLLAIALIGSRAADRSIDLHAAIGLARRRFWRLVLASIAVGLILIIPRQILATALGNQNAESGVLLSTALDIVLSAPFAYVGAAVVLAPATPLQAVRWSWRMARRRWRLAFLIGVVNTAVSYLAGFAVSAGLDILIRIAIGLGIDRGLGTVQSIELVAIVAVAIVAIGSLTMTIAALTVGPSPGSAWADPSTGSQAPPRAASPSPRGRTGHVDWSRGRCRSPSWWRQQRPSPPSSAAPERSAGRRQTPSSSSRSSSMPRWWASSWMTVSRTSSERSRGSGKSSSSGSRNSVIRLGIAAQSAPYSVRGTPSYRP